MGQPDATPPKEFSDAKNYQHIGAYLRDLRKHYDLNVEDVAARLHIRAKYIVALEEGRMEELPGKVYTVGYVHNYAEFLGLDGNDVLAQYEEINSLEDSHTFKIIEPTHQQSTPNHTVLIISAVLIVLGFVLWQFFADMPTQTQDPIVDEVPATLDKKIGAQLVITSNNRYCMNLKQTPAFPPCYEFAYQPVPTAFTLKPVRSILEFK